MKVSFVIPVYNNYSYTKHLYENLKEYYPEDEIVLSDGGSTDETIKYFSSLTDSNLIFLDNGKMSLCQNYNRGVEKATQEIVILLHNDMFIPPDFKEKLLVDLTEDTIVSFSRIEPPVFPGEEPGKIVRDYGYDPETLDRRAVIDFCKTYTSKYEGGGYLFIACYKNRYLGLDDSTYNPPQNWRADDDLHNRYVLTGLPRIISNACVYHYVSKTSRKEGYQEVEIKSARNYLRKWGSLVSIKKYDIGYVVTNCGLPLLEVLEPWCSTIYLKDNYDLIVPDYLTKEQPNTKFDLKKRIKPYDSLKSNDIVVEFDASKLTQQSFQLLMQLPSIIADSGEIGNFELDMFKIGIYNTQSYEKRLTTLGDIYYTNQLI